MAWQISRASSQLCKRYKSSLKLSHLPSAIACSSHGDFQSLLLSTGKNGFPHLLNSTASYYSLHTSTFRGSETLKANLYDSSFTTDALKSSLVLNTHLSTSEVCAKPWTLVKQGIHTSASSWDTLTQEKSAWSWIHRTPASRHAYTAHHLTSNSALISMKQFSSASQSSSHHLERVQELQDVEDGRGEKVEADILDTEDGQVLYSGMKSTELLSTLLNLHLVAYEPLVDLSIKVLKSPYMSYSAYRRPLLAMVKRTVYSHFCAGEDVSEASKTLQRMWELGLKSILDYSLEDAMDNSSCDNNLEGFLQTVHQTKQLPSGSVSFSCVKMTALCPLPLLERISSLLRWQHMHAGFKLPWREEVLPLLADESPMYHVQIPPETLTDEEEWDLQLAKERLWKLCRACDEASLPLLVDAEYTSVQPAIDYYTYNAALEFNKNEHPLVFGTIQAYLKDSLPRLSLAANEAARRRVSFGVKLVRGAYITRESTLAASLGAESPIHSCIEKTHECYDTCAAFMMERAVSAQGAVVLATHNFGSGRTAAAKAETLGLLKGNPHLQFAQLKGMADGLSLALVHAGFQVSKYLPFGPVGHVIPYLIRRAEENRGLLGSTLADRICIRRELKRRLLHT